MSSVNLSENLETIRRVSAPLGIDLLSSARIGEEAREGFDRSLLDLAPGLDYAIVIGIRLSPTVLETVKTAPTWTYYYHYRTVNFALDQAALVISGECQRMGYRAFPVPASQILDWDRLAGHLSHREMAAIAGLGWRGRNNLLVNGEFGSQCRYTTVLTEMPLPDPEPLEHAGCGECVRCVSACPAGAIHEAPEDFDLDRCAAQIRRFSKTEKLNVLICGLCIRACPGAGGPRKAE